MVLGNFVWESGPVLGIFEELYIFCGLCVEFREEE